MAGGRIEKLYINAPDGLLPVGAHMWQTSPSINVCTLTVALIATATEVAAAEQRFNSAFAAILPRASKLKVLRTQLESVKGVSIEGHPYHVNLTGVYTLESEHAGWPVLKNKHGVFLFLFPWATVDCWMLTDDKGDLDTGESIAHLRDTSKGYFPVGAHAWNCKATREDEDEDEDADEDEEPEDDGDDGMDRVTHTLTLALLLTNVQVSETKRRLKA